MDKKNKKKGQKFQNKFAFKVKNKVDHEKLVKETPLYNLCSRCVDIIEWKLQYGKYKKLTRPASCLKCNMKKIFSNYRSLCNPCAEKEKLCAKCSQPKEFKIKEVDMSKAKQNEMIIKMKNEMKKLRLCSKKKILRLVQAGDIDYKEGIFYLKSTGKPVENIQYKNKYKDDEDEDDDDDEEFDEIFNETGF